MGILLRYWQSRIPFLTDTIVFGILFSLICVFLLGLALIGFWFLNEAVSGVIVLIVLSLFASQYNAPNIAIHLQQPGHVHFLASKHLLLRFVLFQILKSNIMIVILFIASVLTLIVSIDQPFKALLILANLFIQLNILFFNIFDYKHKAVGIFLTVLYIFPLFLFRDFMLTIVLIMIINSAFLVRVWCSQLKDFMINRKRFADVALHFRSGNDINIIYSIKMFYRRMAIKDIVHHSFILIILIVALIYLGFMPMQWLVLILFFMDMSFLLDAHKADFDRVYAKHIFARTANVNNNILIFNTPECRLALIYTGYTLFTGVVNVVMTGDLYKIGTFVATTIMIWVLVLKQRNYFSIHLFAKNPDFKSTLFFS